MSDAPGAADSDALAPDAVISGCAYSPDVHTHLRGATGAPREEREPGAHFVLEQNHPNPFAGETTVPFTLPFAADVRLDLFDLLGRKVAGVSRKGRPAGDQSIKLNLAGLGLPTGEYVYQVRATHAHGVFSERKLMTSI
ncbi:MAG: hypothetical protein JWR44_2372 [Hymenobacter sp.]|nr:hypothetical protein [Hymenobacter sp.]